MVPEGTNNAASFPSTCAAMPCSRLTQGSSPKTSSPTSASAMARRMSTEGLVTVSLRRSIMLMHSCGRPLAVKYLNGRASHIDLVIRFVPFEFQPPAQQVPSHPTPSAAGEMAGHRHGRSSSAAGEGFTRAAFPDPHSECLSVEHTHKLGVDALGEGRVMLKARPPRGHVEYLWVVHEHHTVRIPHGDRGDCERGVVDHKRFLQHPSSRALHGNLRPFQSRLTHLYPHFFDHSTAGEELQRQHAGNGLDLDSSVRRHAMVIDILGQTPNAVAAHLRLAAVSIEHAHTEIRAGRGQNENQAVRADAKMPVADRPCHRRRVVDLLLEAIDIDVVIS